MFIPRASERVELQFAWILANTEGNELTFYVSCGLIFQEKNAANTKYTCNIKPVEASVLQVEHFTKFLALFLVCSTNPGG